MADITKNVEGAVAANQSIEAAVNQTKAAQQATHDLNAANRAAQEEAGIAAQMQPINQTIDFLNLYNQRQAAEYAKEKEQEQKRLSRERLGHDIASIAASIGDMTRASEGAPVSPRDWQRIYDNLTAQERANIDNYRVRMAKLHEDEKAARMAQAQAKAKAVGDAQKRQYEWLMADIERNWKGDEAEKNRILQLILKQMEGQSRVDAANARSNGTKQKYINTMLGNTTFQFPDEKSFKNYILSVVDVLNKEGNYKNAEMGEAYKATLLKDQTLSNDPFGYYNKNVVGILRNHWDELTPQAQTDIINSILGHGGVQGNAIQGGGGWSGDEEYDD
jgi:hypothetical protein